MGICGSKVEGHQCCLLKDSNNQPGRCLWDQWLPKCHSICHQCRGNSHRCWHRGSRFSWFLVDMLLRLSHLEKEKWQKEIILRLKIYNISTSSPLDTTQVFFCVTESCVVLSDDTRASPPGTTNHREKDIQVLPVSTLMNKNTRRITLLLRLFEKKSTAKFQTGLFVYINTDRWLVHLPRATCTAVFSYIFSCNLPPPTLTLDSARELTYTLN